MSFLTTFIPNHCQEDIFAFVMDESKGNLMVSAKAGTGKTVTIVEAVKRIPENKSVIILAFSKHIADELRDKVPRNVEVRTTHSMGFEAIRDFNGARRTFGGNQSKMYKIIRKVIDDRNHKYTMEKNKYEIISKMMYNEIKTKLVHTIDHFRNSLMPVNEENLNLITLKFDLSIPMLAETELEIIEKALEEDRADTINIDYTDMIYLSTTMMMPFRKFDYIFVDECLPGRTRILLSNGEEKTISEIVDKQLSVEVVSHNTITKRDQKKKIVGWSKKPCNDKTMLKIIHAEKRKTPEKNEEYYPYHVLFCTDRHLVFTKERGFVYSNDLKIGEHVRFESAHGASHLKNRKGQISIRELPNDMCCEICGKVCGSTAGLGSHMRVHDPDYRGNDMTDKGHKTLSEQAHNRNQNPESRRRMGETINKKMKNGELPVRFGGHIGNGTHTSQQLKLYDELTKHDERWQLEYSIPTGFSYMDNEGYPSNYKVDIAFPEHKVAIEVHGRGHQQKNQIEKDKKKQDLLLTLGWITLEIWNDEINDNIDKCVEKALSSLIGRSPQWHQICSVKEVEYKEEFVYDIEVEDNHNFYAEGTLVHNCQDLNESQLRMLLMIRGQDGRVVGVGDENQAIFQFRGADTDAMEKIKLATKADELPLNICYRCPKTHIIMANQFVPDMEPAPDAIDGEIFVISGEVLYQYIKPGDLAICRNNAPLVRPALTLLRQGVKVNIRGQNLKRSLIDLIKETGANDIPTMRRMLIEYRETEVEKLRKKGKNPLSIIDKVGVILEFAQDSVTIQELINYINILLNDTDAEITFSTVHGAKGLESENIFFINSFLIPSTYAVQAWELQGEDNIMYVALTRAMKKLYFVDIHDREITPGIADYIESRNMTIRHALSSVQSESKEDDDTIPIENPFDKDYLEELLKKEKLQGGERPETHMGI